MLREIVGGSNVTIAETRRVVIAHLRLVVGIIDIRQQHALDGILRIEQFAQDAHHTVGNLHVAHHLAHVHLVVVVPVQGPHMTQVIAPDVGILLEGLALHSCPHTVGYRLSGETFVDAAKGRNHLGSHRLSGLPQLECRCVRYSIVVIRLTRCQYHCAANQDGGKHPYLLCFHCNYYQ